MKTITEIIKQLEQIRDVHGDLEVMGIEYGMFGDGSKKFDVFEVSAIAIHHPSEGRFITVFEEVFESDGFANSKGERQ